MRRSNTGNQEEDFPGSSGDMTSVFLRDMKLVEPPSGIRGLVDKTGQIEFSRALSADAATVSAEHKSDCGRVLSDDTPSFESEATSLQESSLLNRNIHQGLPSSNSSDASIPGSQKGSTGVSILGIELSDPQDSASHGIEHMQPRKATPLSVASGASLGFPLDSQSLAVTQQASKHTQLRSEGRRVSWLDPTGGRKRSPEPQRPTEPDPEPGASGSGGTRGKLGQRLSRRVSLRTEENKEEIEEAATPITPRGRGRIAGESEEEEEEEMRSEAVRREGSGHAPRDLHLAELPAAPDWSKVWGYEPQRLTLSSRLALTWHSSFQWDEEDVSDERTKRKRLFWGLLLLLLCLLLGLSAVLVCAYGWSRGADHGPASATASSSACVGPCCVMTQRQVYTGGAAQTMTSRWWSNRLYNGDQIQLLSQSSLRWVQPVEQPEPVTNGEKRESKNGEATAVGCFSEKSPPPGDFFIVDRIGCDTVRLRTPTSGQVLAVAQDAEGRRYVAMVPDPQQGEEEQQQKENIEVAFRFQQVQGTDASLRLFFPGDNCPVALNPAGFLFCPWILGSATNSDSDGEIFEARVSVLVPPFRGVNLMNYLVREAWMDPDDFVRVPFFMDGLQFRLQSLYTAKFLGFESLQDLSQQSSGQPRKLVCRAEEPGDWETFHLRQLTEADREAEGAAGGGGEADGDAKEYEFRVHADHSFWALDGFGQAQNGQGYENFAAPAQVVTASPLWLNRSSSAQNKSQSGQAQNLRFRLHFNPNNVLHVAIQAVGSSGNFLSVGKDGQVSASLSPSSVDFFIPGGRFWSGPSVFLLSKVSAVRGEWQMGRHYGADEGQMLQDRHRERWVTESDFVSFKKQGLNAVRLPVGYWATQGESPDYPYIPGSLKFLDYAFDMCDRHGLRLLLSLHAAPGSQNGYEHSGSRDGIPDWASLPDNVHKTTRAVEWLAQRYSSRPSFAGIGLLNEPRAEGVPLGMLKAYYTAAYWAVRNHSSCAFVSISPRVGTADDLDLELQGFMADEREFTNVIQEQLFYNVFDEQAGGKNFSANLGFVKRIRAAEILESQGGGKPALVSEWSLALLGHEELLDGQMKEFAQVQLETYAEAAAGWFFFSHKMGRPNWPRWSFEESVANGWLEKRPGGLW